MIPAELRALPSLQPQLSYQKGTGTVGRPRLGGRDIPVSCHSKRVRTRPTPACLPAESGLGS